MSVVGLKAFYSGIKFKISVYVNYGQYTFGCNYKVNCSYLTFVKMYFSFT